MGMGDHLMATGEVKQLYATRAVPVRIIGADGRTQSSPVFTNNPKIAGPQGLSQVLRNGPGLRPYIQGKNLTRWYWRQYAPIPGELYLTDEEREFALPYAGMVMVEPNVKANGHENKAWIWERWQALVDDSPPIVQCGPDGTRWLSGVTRVVTQSFRQACAVLEVSRAFVGTEGGLHHAAAALGIPAVVLWSEFIAPDVTGYATQRNIRHAGVPCGSRVPCKTCAASMAAISVDEVGIELWRVFEGIHQYALTRREPIK